MSFVCVFVCLEDISAEKDETADKVFSKAGNILKEACSNLSGDCIGRTHRIGRDHKCHKTEKTYPSVIVRITSFKDRTSIHLNRSILKDVRVKLDVTKKRYNILKSAGSISDKSKTLTMSLQMLIADLKLFLWRELLIFLKMFQS